MRAILHTLPTLISELRGAEVREAIVFAVWPTVVGEQLRGVSIPVRLEAEILTVAVPGQEWIREFRQHAAGIVFKLNAALKTSIVERLNFVIDPVAVRNSKPQPNRRDHVSPSAVSLELSRAASTITDTELRTNFLKAAAACIERRDAVAK